MPFSLNNTHVVVNYHYVEDPRLDAGGIYPCSVAEFERQIAFLSRYFHFVSVPEVYEAAQNKRTEKLCAITFDDGLKDQFINAVPVLHTYRVPATFFIITSTFAGHTPAAHKLHAIASSVNMEDLLDKFNAFLSAYFPEYIDRFFIPKDRRLTQGRRHDNTICANVKETLTIVPRALSDGFLDYVLKEIGMDELTLSKKLFMDIQEIRSLDADGFVIESHSHDHDALSILEEDRQRKDLGATQDVFHNILGRPPAIIAYPYGRWPVTDTVLNEYGLKYAVTVEPREVSDTDHHLRIPRFDTNDIKFFLDA